MKDHKKKIILIILEVITLAILTIVVYWGTVKLMIGRPIFIMGLQLNGDWAFSGAFLFTVLLVDVIWLVTIKFLPRRNIHVKIIITVIIIAFSGAITTCYMMPSSFGF